MDKIDRIVKSPTREGRACKHDGTTTKYISSGNCVACSIRSSDERAEKTLNERDRKLREKLDALPTTEIIIKRPCRLTLRLLIPKPPRNLTMERWSHG